MKILIIGLGSAGQRHMRNLKNILGDDAEFIAYRVRRLSRQFDDNLNVVEGKSVSESYCIKEYYDLDEALDAKLDFAIIANPNNMHIECALKVAKRGIDIFLEKPVSNDYCGVDELIDIVKRNKIILYVGFQMRFHPCIKKLKYDVENGCIGRIVSVDCQMGELVTKMHKYEDYRNMIESKEAGGGVVICQIHELDYLYWIFGLPKSIYSIGNKYSDLEIEVEDAVTSICRCEKDGICYPIVIHQDYLQSPPTRKCIIVGTEGRIEIDLLKNQYVCYCDGVLQVDEFQRFVRNDMFMEEMQTFLKYIETRQQETLSLKEGVQSLKLALAIKKSMVENCVVEL